jgi:hypothetical protein
VSPSTLPVCSRVFAPVQLLEEEDELGPSIPTWSDGPGRCVPLRPAAAPDQRAPLVRAVWHQFPRAPCLGWAGPVRVRPGPPDSSPILFFSVNLFS